MDLNHCCVSAYQQSLSPCSIHCFDDMTANPEYLCLWSSTNHWILFIDQNNGTVIIGATSISLWLISWSTNALLLIMWQSSKLKFSPNLFNYMPCEARFSDFYYIDKSQSDNISNAHNLVNGSWNCICTHCSYSTGFNYKVTLKCYWQTVISVWLPL